MGIVNKSVWCPLIAKIANPICIILTINDEMGKVPLGYKGLKDTACSR